MAVSQLPQAPHRQDRRVYPTPDSGDVLFSQVKDCSRFEVPAYGTPHPDSVKWPHHKLIFVKPVDIERDGIFEFFYAADREEQDRYNFSFGYRNVIGNAGGREFRVVVRTYLTPRSEFDPEFPAFKTAMPDVPEGTFGGVNYVFYDKKQAKSEPEFDSLYVIEERTYIEDSFLGPKLSYGIQKPDVVPERFRTAIPTISTEEIQEGVASLPTLADDNLSIVEDQLNPNVKLVKETTRPEVTLPVNLPDGQVVVPDYGGLVAIKQESLVEDGTQADSGFGVLESSVSVLGDGKSVKTTIKAPVGGDGNPSFPVIEGVLIDPRYGVPVVSSKQIVPPTTSGGLYTGIDGSIGSVEIEPKNQWHSIKNITYLPRLPDPQVWYGLRRENLPDVLLDLEIVGTERFVAVPKWGRVPDGPLKAKFTRSFSHGPPPDFDPSFSRVYYASEPYQVVIEYESESTSESKYTGTSTSNNTSSSNSTSSNAGTSISNNVSASESKNNSISDGINRTTTRGTSNSASTSDSASTSTSTNASSGTSTNTGTNTSTNTGTSTGTSTSTNTSTNTGTSTGTSTSTNTSTNTGTSTGTSTSTNTSTNTGTSTGTSTSTNTSTNTGKSSGTSTSTNTSTNTGTSTGTSTSTNTSTNTGTSTGTSTSTNTSSNTGTSTGTSTGTNTGTNTGTSTSTNTGTSTGTSTSTSTSTNSGTSSSSGSSSSSGGGSTTQTQKPGVSEMTVDTQRVGGPWVSVNKKVTNIQNSSETVSSSANNSITNSSSNSSSNNSGTSTGTSTSTNTSTNTGTSTGTSTSTSTGTSTSTNTSTNTGTSSGTSTSTNTSTNTGTSSGTSTSTNTSTNTGTSSGTSTSTNTSTNTGTSTGTSTSTNTSTNTGTSTGTSTSSNTSTNTGTSTGTSTSTNTSTNTGTSSGTSTSTNTSTNTGTNTSTSSSSSSSDNSSSATGSSSTQTTGESSSDSTSESSGRNSSSNISTSKSTNSGENSGTNTSTSLSASSNISNSSNEGVSVNKNKVFFTLTIPKCLHDEINITLPTGQKAKIPATIPTTLSGWVEVSRQSEHWKSNIWVTEAVEVFV